MDRGCVMYLWIGAAISDQFCQEVFEVANFQAIPDGSVCQYLRLAVFIKYVKMGRGGYSWMTAGLD